MIVGDWEKVKDQVTPFGDVTMYDAEGNVITKVKVHRLHGLQTDLRNLCNLWTIKNLYETTRSGSY